MARQIKNDFISLYSSLLDLLEWKPLWRCNIERCLLLFYKYYYELHYFPQHLLPKPNTNYTIRRSARIDCMSSKLDAMQRLSYLIDLALLLNFNKGQTTHRTA